MTDEQIQNDQWFADLVDFVEEHGGSMSQEQRTELWELSVHVPRRDASGDLWYGRFSEEAVKNAKLKAKIESAVSWLDEDHYGRDINCRCGNCKLFRILSETAQGANN